MTKTEKTQTPIQQSVLVECPIEEAFQLFTEGFAEWWPLASYSMTGQAAEACGMEPWVDGRVFERTRSGEEHEWGTVIEWNPPTHLTFTWHPAARVDVQFNVEADGTRVTLIHTGWERAGVQTCALSFAKFVSEQMLVAA
jgi:activator of Hsp90 ATPase-like protein